MGMREARDRGARGACRVLLLVFIELWQQRTQQQQPASLTLPYRPQECSSQVARMLQATSRSGPAQAHPRQ